VSGEHVAQIIWSISAGFFPAISKAAIAAFNPKEELCSSGFVISEYRLSFMPVRVAIHLSFVSTPNSAILSARALLVTRFLGKAEPIPVILAAKSITISDYSFNVK
jgi:hypothetical protein